MIFNFKFLPLYRCFAFISSQYTYGEFKTQSVNEIMVEDMIYIPIKNMSFDDSFY